MHRWWLRTRVCTGIGSQVPPIPHPWCNKCEVGPRLQHLRRNFQPPPIGLDSLPLPRSQGTLPSSSLLPDMFYSKPWQSRWQHRPQCPGRPSRNPCEKDYPLLLSQCSTSSPQGLIFHPEQWWQLCGTCLCGKQCQCPRLPQRRTS